MKRRTGKGERCSQPNPAKSREGKGKMKYKNIGNVTIFLLIISENLLKYSCNKCDFNNIIYFILLFSSVSFYFITRNEIILGGKW